MKLNDVANCFQTFLWQIKLDLFRLLSVLFLGGNQISLFKLSDFNICFRFNSMQHSLLRLLYGSDIAQQANTTNDDEFTLSSSWSVHTSMFRSGKHRGFICPFA